MFCASLHALPQVGTDGRNAAAGLEIADRIEHDVGAGLRNRIDLRRRHPDAVGKIEPRREQPHPLQISDQGAGIGRMRLPRDQRHRAGFVDMGVDGNFFAARYVRKLVQELRRASLRTGGAERQGDAGMAMLLRGHDVTQQARQIDPLEGLDRA